MSDAGLRGRVAAGGVGRLGLLYVVLIIDSEPRVRGRSMDASALEPIGSGPVERALGACVGPEACRCRGKLTRRL